MTPIIVAQRIKEAREARGLNQSQLAQRLGWKSHASIVALEQGQKDLKMWELLKIAEVLGISPESLYSENPIATLIAPSILWRQRGKDPEAIRHEEQLIFQYCEDYRLLEQLIELPYTSTRQLPERPLDIEKGDLEWANRLADELYRELNLGDYPAEVLARRLEDDFGVILLQRPLENGAAACSRRENNIVILMNENDIPWRQVFSLAHELFHIITWNTSLLQKIHDNASLFTKNEQLADAFAAALLMPQQMIERDLYKKKLTYSIIVAMARQYGVSTTAMLWRLCHLRFLTSETVNLTLADNEFKKLDKATYKEAFKLTSLFCNKFLRLAYLVFESGRLSKARLARMLGVNLRDLEKHLSIHGFELTNDKEIIANIG